MSKTEVNTKTPSPVTQYEFSEHTFESAPSPGASQSNLQEIDFPKSRTITFSDTKDVISFSVNYGRVDSQMKNFNSNKSNI